MDSFADWMLAPSGSWPLARISDADAKLLATEAKVAMLSAETAAKQDREHPELLGLDYLMAQRTIDQATRRVQDTPNSLIYILEQADANGYVLVVKVTKSKAGLFVQSFRRLSGRADIRGRTIRRLLGKEE